MPSKNLYSYNNSYIKHIWVELPDYSIDREKLKSTTNKKFVGREFITNQVISNLLVSRGNASYLITGYRGMGKTLFMDRILRLYAEKFRYTKPKVVKINFGQKNIKEIDIFRQVIFGIKENLLRKTPTIRLPVFNVFGGRRFSLFFHEKLITYRAVPVIALIILLVRISLIDRFYEFDWGIGDQVLVSMDNIEVGTKYLIVTAAAFAISYVAMHIAIGLKYLIFPIYRIYDELQVLYLRCQGKVESHEKLGFLDKLPFFQTRNNVSTFDSPNPKEIENEIINKIGEIKDLRAHREYVFVFDEIDKIDPAGKDMFSLSVERTQLRESLTDESQGGGVIDVLANLKYLITTAEAKFIFIAGREMFDASLADIADRQSSIGSIFHQVINVESFLKDRRSVEASSGVSSRVEDYLSRLLIPKPWYVHTEFYGYVQKLRGFLGVKRRNNEKLPFLKEYMSLIADSGQQNSDFAMCKAKITNTLQQFVVYLTYRSNGSPKKLARMVEEMVFKEPPSFKGVCDSVNLRSSSALIVLESEDDIGSIYVTHNTFRSVIRRGFKFFRNVSQRKLWKNKRYFLRINYADQHRISILNYLYRPLMISFGTVRKSLSDKLLVSTSFLFDHIIKYHPVAFSFHHLETIPEVMSRTRSPEVRPYLMEIVEYLKRNHIRDSEIGLFEHTFNNLTRYELIYLSRLFEEESAAFNFSLNENNNVRLYFELQKRAISGSTAQDGVSDNPALIFINDRIGDLEYFDQHYGEAVSAYTEALDKLENVLESESSGMNWFLIKVRLKMKIGLALEKVSDFEGAMGIYVETTNEILRKTKKIKLRGLPIHELVQIIIQPFIARLYLIEKLNVNGVSFLEVILVYMKLRESIDHSEVSFNKYYGVERSYFFSHIGTLLYYKNFFLSVKGRERVMKALKDWRQESKKEKKKAVNNYLNNWCLACIKYLKESEGDREFIYNFIQAKEKKADRDNTHFDLKKLYNLNEVTRFLYGCAVITLADLAKSQGELKLDSSNFDDIVTESLKNLKYLLVSEQNGSRLRLDKTFSKNIAIALSKYGDLLFSNLCTENIKIEIDEEVLKQKNLTRSHMISVFRFEKIETGKHFEMGGKEDKKKLGRRDQIFLQNAMSCFYWSSEFYKIAGKLMDSNIQMRKVMDVSRMTMARKSLRRYLRVFEEYFFPKCVYNSSVSNESSNRFQIYKQKFHMGFGDIETPPHFVKYLYTYQSNSPEIKEILALMIGLYFKSNRTLTEDSIRNVLSPYSVVSSQYCRLMELNLQHHVNLSRLKVEYPEFISFIDDKNGMEKLWWEFKHAQDRIEEKLKCSFSDYLSSLAKAGDNDGWYNNIAKLNEIAELTCSSVRAMYQNIIAMQQYGIGYFITYSEFGDCHRRMGYWLSIYEFLKLNITYKIFLVTDVNKGQFFDLDSNLGKMIGANTIGSLDSLSYYQKAYSYYAAAIQMHTHGEESKSRMAKMYYLQDDYSDPLYHYSIARERYRINTGRVMQLMDDLETKVLKAKVNQVGLYLEKE